MEAQYFAQKVLRSCSDVSDVALCEGRVCATLR